MPFYRIIWRKIVPLKVRILSWLVLNNSPLTRDRLKNKHLITLQMCLFCKQVEETLEHILLFCPFTLAFWSHFSFYFKFSLAPHSIGDWWLEWRCVNIPDNLRCLWDIIMLAFIWILWRERNNRIFNASSNNFCFLFNSIIFFSNFWAGHFARLVKKRLPCVRLEDFGSCPLVSTARGSPLFQPRGDDALLLPGSPFLRMGKVQSLPPVMHTNSRRVWHGISSVDDVGM